MLVSALAELFKMKLLLIRKDVGIIMSKIVQLSISHGVSVNTAFGFAYYSTVLCHLGNLCNASKYEKFALEIMQFIQARQKYCQAGDTAHTTICAVIYCKKKLASVKQVLTDLKREAQ
eukprot:12869277-Ditylum_brightwellii.AAC.1